MDGNDPLKALKWGLDAYFWEGAHAIWGYEGEHTFDALMTWLFVNNATRRIGLVGYWDVVAFDEFAGRKRVERSLVDTLKNYLANKSFSRGYGLIVDYLAEALRHLRTLDYSGDLDTLATLDPAMSKRDQDAVRKTFSGLAKLIFPARDGAPEELSDGLPKSDSVVDARGDSRPASPVFDRRALLKSRAIPIRYKIEPSKGHSMPGILLPYLFDAAEIQIRDPYLRKPHQIRNVHEILLLLIQHADAARLPRVVIETCASDEDEYRAKQEATFEQLQQSWGQFGIVIDWSIVDYFHDRSIVTDTGWVIDLGRGLDVYEAYTPLSQFDPRYAIPQLRRTKEITINVSRDTEGHA